MPTYQSYTFGLMTGEVSDPAGLVRHLQLHVAFSAVAPFRNAGPDVACRPHVRLNRDGLSGFGQTSQRHLFSLSAIEVV
jgi:hypothetical protein